MAVTWVDARFAEIKGMVNANDEWRLRLLLKLIIKPGHGSGHRTDLGPKEAEVGERMSITECAARLKKAGVRKWGRTKIARELAMWDAAVDLHLVPAEEELSIDADQPIPEGYTWPPEITDFELRAHLKTMKEHSEPDDSDDEDVEGKATSSGVTKHTVSPGAMGLTELRILIWRAWSAQPHLPVKPGEQERATADIAYMRQAIDELESALTVGPTVDAEEAD